MGNHGISHRTLRCKARRTSIPTTSTPSHARDSDREASREALTGVRIGQPTSREREIVSGADDVRTSEGNTAGRVIRERPADPAWSKTLACAYASCAETGRSHGRPTAN